MGSPSSFNRMMDTRGSNPLQDLLDEEKRLQQSKLDGDAGNRATTSLLSDQDFEKLKADVVNDPCECHMELLFCCSLADFHTYGI